MLKALLLSITLLLPSLAESQEPRHRVHRHTRQVVKIADAAVAAPLVAKAVDFDGTNDFIARGSDLTGNVDGKKGTLSVWIRLDGSDGVRLRIISSDSSGFTYERSSGDRIRVAAENAAGTVILDIETDATHLASAAWIHTLVAWDLSVPVARLFIDDVDDERAGSTETNDTIDYTKTEWVVGARFSGSNKFDGCISELYLNTSEFIDISVESNRRKFIDASGKPVSLGSDGSTPTGTQPILYLNGDSTNFQTNQGSGGNFSVTGSLDDCSTSPSD